MADDDASDLARRLAAAWMHLLGMRVQEPLSGANGFPGAPALRYALVVFTDDAPSKPYWIAGHAGLAGAAEALRAAADQCGLMQAATRQPAEIRQ